MAEKLSNTVLLYNKIEKQSHIFSQTFQGLETILIFGDCVFFFFLSFFLFLMETDWRLGNKHKGIVILVLSHGFTLPSSYK